MKKITDKIKNFNIQIKGVQERERGANRMEETFREQIQAF